MESSLSLFTEALGPIVAGSDFKVEMANIAAVVFILDAQVRNGNLAMHHFQIELARDRDSFVSLVFVGPHPRKGSVEVFLQLEVEDNAPDFAA